MSQFPVYQKIGVGIPTPYITGLVGVGSFTPQSINVNTGTATGTQINPPNQIWQSFTTTSAGQLFTIQWDFAVLPANGGYVAKLYLGNGIGGTLLATVNTSGSGSPATLVIDFTSVLPSLANATQYTIQITPNVGTTSYTLDTLTGYSGGNAIIGPPQSFPIRVFTGNITNYFTMDNSGNAQFLNTVNIGTIGANQVVFGNGSSILSGDSNLTYRSLGSVNTILLNVGTINLGGSLSNTDGKKISVYDPNPVTSPTNRFQHTGFGTTNGVLEVELYDNTKSVQFYAATSTLTRTNIASLSGSGVLSASQGLFSGTSGVSVSGSAPSVHVGTGTDLGEATAGGNFCANAVSGDSVLRCSSSTNTIRILGGSGTSILDITSSLASLNFPITFPQTQGGSAVSGSIKTNNEYFEYYIHTTNMTGAISITGYICQILRINNVVILMLPSWTGAATATATEIFSTAIPARFRPLVIKKQAAVGNRNAQRSTCVQIDTTGIATFFGDETGGNYNSGQTSSCLGATIIYPVS